MPSPLTSPARGAPAAPGPRTYRWLPIVLILLAGSAIFAPTLVTPPLFDDFMHQAMVEETVGLRRGPLDLYDFVNERDRAVMLERGLLPWWSSAELTIRFFRPLSSLLRWLELQHLPGRFVLMHLHSLLWWVAAVLAVRALLRRALPPRPALVATAIFALGPWHVLPLAWLANREILLSMVFGALGLSAALRYSSERRATQLALGALWFALAFAAGEYAFCMVGYVVAIEGTAWWRSGRARMLPHLLGLAPCGLAALGYLLVRAHGGYGTRGSSFYSDPLAEPLKFLSLAPARLVTLLGEGWLTLGTSAWGTGTPRWLIVAMVLGAIAILAVPLRRTFAALEPPVRTSATWLLSGSLLAIVPVLAVVPAPRVLGIAAVGIAATAALLIEYAWFSDGARAPDRRGVAELTQLGALLLAFSQLVHGPIAAFISSAQLRADARAGADSLAKLARRFESTGVTDLGVLRGGGAAFFAPFAMATYGFSPPRWRILSQTGHVLMLRKDALSFELVAAPDAPLYAEGRSSLFRDGSSPLAAGAVVRVPGMQVRILDVGPGGPTRALFTFEEGVALEETRYAWLNEGVLGWVRPELPKIGFGTPFDP